MSETTKALTDGKEKPKHELPDDQVKGTEGEDLPARLDEAREINDMMSEIRHRTNPDGTLLGKVKRIHIAEKNPRIAVMVDLPAEDEDHRFEFLRPKVWSKRYDFVRFVEHYADHPGDIEYLVEENVDVNIKELDAEYRDDYAIVYPDESSVSKTRRRIRERIVGAWRSFKSGKDGAASVVGKVCLTTGLVGVGTGLAMLPTASQSLVFNSVITLMASIVIGAVFAAVTAILLVGFGHVVYGWDGPPT